MNTDTAMELSGQKRLKLSSAFGGMPYGGVIRFEFPDEGQTPGSLLANLTALKEYLEGAVERDQRMENSLHAMRQDRFAMQRMLGDHVY